MDPWLPPPIDESADDIAADLWLTLLNPDCEHDQVAIEPGSTPDDECIGYCDNCGIRLEMGFSWSSYEIEVDFNRWAALQAGA
jgi:hypothetical protein